MSLWRWFGWQKRPVARDVHVVMLTRRGCHLCDEAWEQLERQQRRYGFRLETVDVDTDSQLAAEHGNWVPVVLVNGKVRFRGCVNPVLLRRILDAGEPGA